MYEYLWLFIVYAFLGWCTEVAYAAVTSGKFVNRGFLNGPICPVYGFGMAAVIALLTPLQGNKLILFLGAVIVTSLIEFLTGWTLERIFKQRWWSYSDMPFNIGGYICLRFSLLWGLACLLIMDIIQPGIVQLISMLPESTGRILLVIIYLTMLIDLLATAQTVLKINKQLEEVNKIAEQIHDFSDDIGKIISSKSLKAASRLEESIKRLESLKEQRNDILNKNFFGKRRIFRAFPKATSIKYKHELEQIKKKILGVKHGDDDQD